MKRGKRLPESFTPTEANLKWSAEKGFDKIVSIETETEKFIDYWLSASGKNAVKLDWQRAWRNWIRNAVEYKRPFGKNVSNIEKVFEELD